MTAAVPNQPARGEELFDETQRNTSGEVVDLAEVRARKEAAASWGDPAAATPAPAPEPPKQQAAAKQSKVWGSQANWRGGDFPLPQIGPDQGTMKLPPNFRPIDRPGRCVACGFHVPTQMHRTYCPRTGQDGNLSQARHFRHLRN